MILGKIMIGLGTYLVGNHYYKLLKLTESEMAMVKTRKSMEIALSLIDKVVKSPDNENLYLLKKIAVKYPTRIIYDSYEAYVRDGQKEIVVLPAEIIQYMMMTSNARITINGFAWDKES